MSNKINMKNYLTRLGIEYDDLISTLNELTDEQVDEAYVNRLTEAYVNMSVKFGDSLNENAKQSEVQIRNHLNEQLHTLSPKAKILILEDKIRSFANHHIHVKDVDLLLRNSSRSI